MLMPYQLSISQDGRTLFDTCHLSSWTVQRLKTLFPTLDDKFPENEGYVLTVERFQACEPVINREIFRTACASGDPKDILRLFVEDGGFRAFQQQRTHWLPAEMEGHIDSLHYYEYLTEVILYEEGYYILKRQEGEFISYLLPGCQDLDSGDLEELEYELYLSFLGDR
jgi:hypothetical protein